MSKVLVMTGGPGVGRPPSSKHLTVLAAEGTEFAVRSSARRETNDEATGFEAKTIHRLLEVDPKSGGFEGRRQPARL